MPQFEHGVIELVRNSYDADSRYCRVSLTEIEKLGGTLTIADDGVGMTPEQIRNGWLLLGSSPKVNQTLTPLGRRPIGEKGLGRLAGLRMGHKATLISRPSSRPGIEYRLSIDWRDFERASSVEEVPLTIQEFRSNEAPGTIVRIEELRNGLTRRDIERLARALILLADPFDSEVGFRTELKAPLFEDLEKRVKNAYFDDAHYRLAASLDETGRTEAVVFNENGVRLWNRSMDTEKYKLSDVRLCVPIRFEFWTFLLSGQKFSNRSSTVGEVRRWLEVVGGVHLYHRGLRVHPYGDRGFDWLEINTARVRSPEERPSTNNSIGQVVVQDHLDLLLQKTDRTGFIENEAFDTVKRFAKDSLDWLARERLTESERRRRETRRKTGRKYGGSKRALSEAVDKLPEAERREVEVATREFTRAVESQTAAIQEDLQLYRTLASVGTAMSVFAHEGDRPISLIQRMADSIERRARNEMGSERYENLLAEPLTIVVSSTRALSSFAAVPNSMIRREKRRVGRTDVHSVVSSIILLFQGFLDESKVNCKTDFVNSSPLVWGSVAALESIVSNLIINSINAFATPEATLEDRQLIVRTRMRGNWLRLSVLDNGPGIVNITVDEIWLPGRTTVPGGTGMGLTIVKDAATDLGGSVDATAHGELKGAELVVQLPTLGE